MVTALAARENRGPIDVTGAPAEINRSRNAVPRTYEADALGFIRIAVRSRRIDPTRVLRFRGASRTHMGRPLSDIGAPRASHRKRGNNSIVAPIAG